MHSRFSRPKQNHIFGRAIACDMQSPILLEESVDGLTDSDIIAPIKKEPSIKKGDRRTQVMLEKFFLETNKK
jgi:hypothetical protein